MSTPLQRAAAPLRPPLKFGIVETGVYRSDVPTRQSFRFLSTLKLKTAVMLSPDKPFREVVQFMKSSNIELVHLGLKLRNLADASYSTRVDWRPVQDELVKEALEQVLNTAAHPILLMCQSGVHESGIVVCCLRRMQKWPLTSCIAEYRMFASQGKARHTVEQFVELFDVDLISVPQQHPDWWKRTSEPDAITPRSRTTGATAARAGNTTLTP